MRRTRTALALGGLLLASAPALQAPAQALQAPTAFVSASSPTWQTNDIAFAVAQSHGLVVVGGVFTSVRPPGAAAGTGETARSRLVVLDAATGAPTSCAPAVGGTATTGNSVSVRTLTFSPDGATLYLGGFFSSVAGVARRNVAAVDLASCTVVSGFDPGPTATVRALAASSSTLYYAGDFASDASGTRGRSGAVGAVGTATAGKPAPWSASFDKTVRTLALSPDGTSVVAGGEFTTVSGVASHALAVLDPAGATRKAFGATFVPTGSAVKDLAVDDTGFYTGNEGTGTGVFDGRIAVAWDSWAQRWRDTCLGATQAVVVYRSVLYSGSHAHNCGSMGEFPDGARNHLLAEPTSGPTLVPWFPQTNDGLGESLGPRDMVVAPTESAGDQMYVVGEFTTVNGAKQQGVTRFGQGTDTAAPSTATSSATSPAAGTVRVAWRKALDTDDSTLTYRLYRDSGTTPVSTQTADSWFWSRQQLTFTDAGLVAGSSHTYRVDVTDGTTVVKSSTKTVKVASSSSRYADRVRADGAVLQWRYDDPADVFISDSSSGAANGTLRGTATAGATGALTGDASKALTLGGSTTTIYSEKRWNWPASTPFSVETWFRTTTTKGGKIIGMGDKRDYQSAAYDKHVYMRDDGRLTFGVQSGGVKTLTSTSSYNDGAWHHVVGTLGSAGMTLYVDGAAVATTTSVTTSLALGYGYWRVGGDTLATTWPGAPTSAFWQGTVDETAVYPTALSAATVKAHHDLGVTGQ